MNPPILNLKVAVRRLTSDHISALQNTMQICLRNGLSEVNNRCKRNVRSGCFLAAHRVTYRDGDVPVSSTLGQATILGDLDTETFCCVVRDHLYDGCICACQLVEVNRNVVLWRRETISRHVAQGASSIKSGHRAEASAGAKHSQQSHHRWRPKGRTYLAACRKVKQ